MVSIGWWCSARPCQSGEAKNCVPALYGSRVFHSHSLSEAPEKGVLEFIPTLLLHGEPLNLLMR